MEYLAANIKKVRVKWGYSQEHFASLFEGMNRGKIGTYETRSIPEIGFMVRLEELSQIPVAHFYKRELLIEEIPPHPIMDGKILSSEKGTNSGNIHLGELQDYLQQLEQRIINLENASK